MASATTTSSTTQAANKAVAKAPLPATLIATALGAGYVPVAPGTAGTVVAIPLAWAAARLGPIGYLLVLGTAFGLGVWAADVYCRAMNTEDDQRIVIDEVVGYLASLIFVPKTPLFMVIGFGLFRLFDAWKPWPIRQLDRDIHGGIGVVLDDVAAGLVTAGLLWGLSQLDIVRTLAATLIGELF